MGSGGFSTVPEMGAHATLMSRLKESPSLTKRGLRVPGKNYLDYTYIQDLNLAPE